MKTIELTQNQIATVDDNVYSFLKQWKWNAIFQGNSWYAFRVRNKNDPEGTSAKIWMHRVVIEFNENRKMSEEEVTHHRDHNGLNNLYENIEAVTVAQNNRHRKQEKTSIFPGVSWDKKMEKYKAQIKNCGKSKTLGYWDKQTTAYAHYQQACEIVDSGNQKAINKLMNTRTPASKYKGVTYCSGKYVANPYIGNGNTKYLGRYDSEIDAYQTIQKYLNNNTN